MSSTAVKVLLDSTYILPTFGIEVVGLTDEDLLLLREAGKRGKVEYYCLSVTWIEIIGKVCKESKKRQIDLETVDIAVESLLHSGFYKWIQPPPQAVKIAFNLRILGHRDNIDNLLYATSITNNMVLLTMDQKLRNFLEKHNYKTENILTHKQLLRKIRNNQQIN